ncbi:MAG TPA: sigma-54 dependent transcriptional regulator [Smithellaceae bacterium]|nr:sigma-54 dependent transcriptional regulator [Smithellaceae bacterium]
MKKKYYVNLYILIPLIYTGIMIIGAVLAWRLSGRYAAGGDYPGVFGFTGLVLFLSVLTFAVSVLIIRRLLKPLVQFFEHTQENPVLKNAFPKSTGKITDDVEGLEKVFKNVVNILSLVEAKELFPDIVGASPAMRNLFTQITKVAPTDSTVLICGESGTGKELIAHSIYEHSARKGKPFITINCVAIPEGLLESELFGHEKGAFTGAVAQKKGKFELADGGTIFLDEIGDMPLATQAKLLRVLQEKEFERVGGSAPLRVDVRFIAATNKDLPRLIREGLFREDLYFRLNVFSVSLPPLRDRREDIPLLASFFLAKQPRKVALSPGVLQILIGYSWPGNIRELRNVLEQAAVLADKDVIEPYHLPEALRRRVPAAVLAENDNNNIGLNERLMIMEKEMILDALRAARGVQVKAAGILGINQRSLWHRIKKLNIDVNSVKHLQ